MRINARLDPTIEKKITKIQEDTNKTITEIIKESVDIYYELLYEETKEKNKKILKTLSGIAEGPEDLSENHDKYLKEIFNREK